MFLNFPSNGVAEGLLTQQQLNQDVHGQTVTREYWTYVPGALAKNPALVVVIHGYTDRATNIMQFAGMNDLADEHGFIVAYPQGSIDQLGNAFFEVGYEFHSKVEINDIDFIEAMVGLLQQQHALDSDSIFATGMSNGGDLSYLLACESSSLFRAVAPVAGTMMLSKMRTCKPTRAMPILAIHGTDDVITLFDGDLDNVGAWGPYLSQQQIIDFWVEHHDLQQTAIIKLADSHQPFFGDNSTISLEQYAHQGDTTALWFYRVTGGGHDWPGARLAPWWDPRRHLGRLSVGFGKNQDIDASAEIWAFFSKWQNAEAK